MDSPENILLSLIMMIYAALGLCLGSFASAIAHRIAIGESWIVEKKGADVAAARSCCPSCGHTLSVLDLIPLFSWLFLGGKCRYCHVKISARYPVIELIGALTIVLFVLTVEHAVALLLFVITLPFTLALGLLLLQKIKPPIYVYGLFFSNIFVWISAVLYEKGSI